MSRLVVVVILMQLMISVWAQAATVEPMQTEVAATEGRTCVAYLHGAGGGASQRALPVVVFLAGTGLYSTHDLAIENDVVQALFAQNLAVALSIEKPGVRYSQETPGHYLVNDRIYNRHHQRDLIECVINAIKWSATSPAAGSASDLYFVGHSEGSQVAARVYQRLLQEAPATAGRVKGLFLSGVVMRSWRDIINEQITDTVEREKFWDAYRRKDDAVLRSYGELAFAYWEDILNTEANDETLRVLAQRSPQAYLQIYQGLKDENTLPQPVMTFEEWNLKRLAQGQAAWRLNARYYQAGHGLNLAALNDMIFALLAFLSP